MRVAVGQLTSGYDVEANRRAVAQAVESGARQGARLVVVPEAAMTPFGAPGTDLSAVAEPLDGPFVASLGRLAGRLDVTVIAGMFEPADDQRVYNTVVAIGPSGLLGWYRKVHLFDALGWKESERVAPGDPAEAGLVVPVDEFLVGVLTCYDLRFPELARVLVDNGATAIAVPAAWVAGPGKVAQWRTLLQARAIENTVYAVAADQSSPGFSGHSMIVEPSGDLLDELGSGPDAATALADLDLGVVDRVRKALPVLEHRRFDVSPRAATATLGPSLRRAER